MHIKSVDAPFKEETETPRAQNKTKITIEYFEIEKKNLFCCMTGESSSVSETQQTNGVGVVIDTSSLHIH